MATLIHGMKNNYVIPQGDVLTLDASNPTGTATVWFTKSGKQDVLAGQLSAGQRKQFGPYAEQTYIRVEQTSGVITVSTDPISDPVGSPAGVLQGTVTKPVSGATYTLTNDDHGYMLLFAAACTVTVPKGLRSDFSCGWSQESAGAVTFAAGSGVTLQSKGGGLASSAQYSMGGLACLGVQDTIRVMGI